MVERASAFVKNNWKYLIGAIVVVALFVFAKEEYQDWKQHIKEQAAKPTVTTTLPPQKIETKTEIIREVAVQAPSQPGAVLSFVERKGKIIAVIDGKEVEVPNMTGQPSVSLGENGELRLSQTTLARIDVTDMANAQARLIAEKELDKQAAVHKKELDKEKSARKRERLLWIVGTAGGTYMLTK